MSLRQRLISTPLMGWYKGLLPSMSDTERAALEAGTVWWEAELFAGNPDWSRFADFPKPALTPKEQDFIDGPVEELCAMLNDWEIEFQKRDLPEAVWDFMKSRGFFGMIIPEEYGGLGFSAYAHSEVVKRISSCSTTAAVTVMVPNSLGPGELLMQYGTDDQKRRYLPGLASGKEIPCFALTAEDAGSDASGMEDVGIVCHGEWQGESVLGLSLSFDKRYITLGPKATLIGLAFKLKDPDGLLGTEEDLGITVALVPADCSGVSTGRRHYPAALAFQNGPVRGENVFIPLDQILGGREQIGQGWKMLMGALAAGRGISLPSLSTAGAQLSAYTTGAYARIRRQFDLSIGKFEGVREALARIAGTAYLLEAARRLTTVGIDAGEKPAVVSAIMKYHATTRMRGAVNDAMDVHGGKAICDGPLNYLGTVYRAIPIGITVEGANILTRSLIIFGQGSIRCHPYLIREMDAVTDPDKKAGRQAFDKALFGHIGYQCATVGRAFWRSFIGGGTAPGNAGDLARYYKRLSRYSAALALVSEIALATMGGALKRKESISARLGDILAELYLLSAALKRFEDEGRPAADRPLLDWCFETGELMIEQALDGVLQNFPSSFWSFVARRLTMPWGRRRRPPTDKLMNRVAELVQEPGETRNRLTTGVMQGPEGSQLFLLDKALQKSVEYEELFQKLKDADMADLDEAERQGILSEKEAQQLRGYDTLIHMIVAVDDFDPKDLSP